METYENTYVDFLTPQLGKVIIGVYSADVLLEFLATDSYKIFLVYRNKRESRSYFEISVSVGVDEPSQVLFVTDVYAEAVAAKAAGKCISVISIVGMSLFFL